MRLLAFRKRLDILNKKGESNVTDEVMYGIWHPKPGAR